MAELATLARPYAKALFAVALDRQHENIHSLSQWSAELRFLSLLSKHPTARALFDTPTLSSTEKTAIIVRLGSDILSRTGNRFVQILATHGRLGLLPDIQRQYEVMRAAHEQSLEVEVVSAFELDDAQTRRLQQTLKQRFERDIHMHSRTDKSLIGGVIIRAGDTVIDGSVRGRLGKLAEALQRT